MASLISLTVWGIVLLIIVLPLIFAVLMTYAILTIVGSKDTCG